MFSKIILNLIVGLLGGFILEFLYRSINAKKIIIPKFIDSQMYALTGAFLSFIYFLNISILIKLILIFVFPVSVEFITGYLYLKIKGTYLWDYSKEPFNFKKLICLRFALYWFIIAVIFYCLITPLLN